MKAKVIKQIALDVFGSVDGIRPLLPYKGGKIQEAMEESFKAGQEQEHKAMIGVAVDEGNKAYKAGVEEEQKHSLEYANELRRYYEEKIKEAKSFGIREVVEWGNEPCPHPSTFDGQKLTKKKNCPECWKSQLKEWGIEL